MQYTCMLMMLFSGAIVMVFMHKLESHVVTWPPLILHRPQQVSLTLMITAMLEKMDYMFILYIVTQSLYVSVSFLSAEISIHTKSI